MGSQGVRHDLATEQQQSQQYTIPLLNFQNPPWCLISCDSPSGNSSPENWLPPCSFNTTGNALHPTLFPFQIHYPSSKAPRVAFLSENFCTPQPRWITPPQSRYSVCLLVPSWDLRITGSRRQACPNLILGKLWAKERDSPESTQEVHGS